MKLRAALLVLLLFSCPAQAATIAPEGTVARKAQRGFLNVALSPFEMAEALHQSTGRDSVYFIPSWIPALFEGAFRAAGRAVVGTTEIITAPIPGNEEPILKPEFAWEYFEHEKCRVSDRSPKACVRRLNP